MSKCLQIWVSLTQVDQVYKWKISSTFMAKLAKHRANRETGSLGATLIPQKPTSFLEGHAFSAFQRTCNKIGD